MVLKGIFETRITLLLIRKLIAFLILSTLVSCNDDEPVANEKPNPLEGLPDEGPVSFDNPVIGQRSYYVNFHAFDKTDTKNIRFEYTTDTLVMAVTGKEFDRWILKEFITEGSTFLSSDTVFTLSYRLNRIPLHLLTPPMGVITPIFLAFPPMKVLSFRWHR